MTGPALVCPHGNNPKLGICPDCDHVKMQKRQRKADRARFQEQLRRIKGGAR